MLRSEQINELASALSKAQGQFPILQKRTQGYNYKYAELPEIIECIQPHLEANGLCLTTHIDWHEVPRLVMTLLHSSGQWTSCEMRMEYKPDGRVNAMRAMGSATTYARRYCISCLLNLAADKESDDDGDKSSPKSYINPNTGEVRKLTDKQLESVGKWVKNKSLVETFKSRFSICESMSQEDFGTVMTYVKQQWEREQAQKKQTEEENGN